MKATISKDFAFSASHVLDTLGDGHPCARLHGHNYLVRVEVSGEVDAHGMVLDYGELDGFAQLLAERYDHRHLNDVLPLSPPTAENLAATLATEARAFVPTSLAVRVGVAETPRVWAWTA